MSGNPGRGAQKRRRVNDLRWTPLSLAYPLLPFVNRPPVVILSEAHLPHHLIFLAGSIDAGGIVETFPEFPAFLLAGPLRSPC